MKPAYVNQTFNFLLNYPGSITPLLTSPVSVWGIVLGKFFAMAAVFALPCAVDAVMIFILWALGGTVSALIANLAGLLCYFLLGCAAIALCEFLSGLTENQIIAAVAGFSLAGFDALYRQISVGAVPGCDNNSVDFGRSDQLLCACHYLCAVGLSDLLGTLGIQIVNSSQTSAVYIGCNVLRMGVADVAACAQYENLL